MIQFITEEGLSDTGVMSDAEFARMAELCTSKLFAVITVAGRDDTTGEIIVGTETAEGDEDTFHVRLDGYITDQVASCYCRSLQDLIEYHAEIAAERAAERMSS